jgi:hypothetical protein
MIALPGSPPNLCQLSLGGGLLQQRDRAAERAQAHFQAAKVGSKKSRASIELGGVGEGSATVVTANADRVGVS